MIPAAFLLPIAKRRQHLMPDPQPSSVGKICTKTMQ
jgi:hypothetical protein